MSKRWVYGFGRGWTRFGMSIGADFGRETGFGGGSRGFSSFFVICWDSVDVFCGVLFSHPNHLQSPQNISNMPMLLPCSP